MKNFKKILQIALVSILIIITLLSVISSVINKSKLESIKEQDENIVFYGDSITEGYNVKEFYDKFQKGIYEPELLFEDKEIIERIKEHPMIIWKLSNKWGSEENEWKEIFEFLYKY